MPQLQKRGRWTTLTREVKVGDLAILKDETIPPLQWKLVRIIAVHPEADGVVRVITQKSSFGAVLKRSMTKIELVPKSEESEENLHTVPNISI